ncbi:hypothetical protein [Phenylobacterium sp.]|jgi:hypothetical protein|uniref:hypothetical protein n=1 Tax=Phenylobacterium sp. TaxID=1871053 RepID=UPI002F93CE08
MRRLILAAVLALAACAAPAASSDAPKPIRPAPSGGAHPDQPESPGRQPPDAAACARQGGTVRPVCMLGRPMCVIPFADAGKACTDGDQCQGDCRFQGAKPPPGGKVTGQCQRSNDPCGCFSNVEDGQVTGGLCVD